VTGVQRIFVADVHGCTDEFDDLLERARDAFGDRFELWIVGDLINRGPGNLRALLRVRELVERRRARYVLGNHELGLLLTAAGLRRLRARDTFTDVLTAPDASDWIEWLRRRPLVETGRLGRQPFAVVHAASHPDWGLEELQRHARRVEARLGGADRRDAECFLAADPRRDPERDDLDLFTCCRSVTRSGGWTSEAPTAGADAWHQRWASRHHGYGIVYGHWALQGLHVAPWLRGLDTGCVHHGRGRDGALTAWLPDPDSETPFDLPDQRFWRIPASRVYYLA
jgi:bis(5'-nucleosyl)-tetraphosphatase (symmetrical)